jgi:hypothetical protein
MEQPSSPALNALRDAIESDDDLDLDLDHLLGLYETEIDYSKHSVLSLVEDIELFAALYWNVIEDLKHGETAAATKKRYSPLLNTAMWPNPRWSALFERALHKLSKLRRALVSIVHKFGGRLLSELSIETGLTVGLGVNLGLPPSVSVSIEHEAKVVSEMQWAPARQQQS